MFGLLGLGLAELLVLGVLAAIGIAIAFFFGWGGGSDRQD